MHTFRLLRLTGVVCAILVGNDLSAQPTIMWTASESTPVMSGPADSYYPVLKLPRGTQLEVHEKLDSGWLAIRPPEGSFSLVSATAIESVDYRTGRVTRDGAASRVGSALVDETSAVHVRLQLGELVEVLDPTADPLTHLIRIAPPAGEFRWVRATDLSARPVSVSPEAQPSRVETPTATSEASGQPASTASANHASAAEAAASPVPTEPPVPSVTPPADGEWRVREEEPTSGPPQPGAGNIEVVRFDATESDTPASQDVAVQHPSADPSAATGSSIATGAGASPSQQSPSAGEASAAPTAAFGAQLDMLEINLSRRIAGPAHLWAFDDLEKEAARLTSLATQPEEMGRLRELSSRMARFAEIASRHRAAAAPQVAGLAPPATAGGAPSTAASTAEGYDAVGVLRPVVSRRAGAPPYALVDDRGEVITFVTPGPSVNLQAYLGQRVAVSGTRAYLPAYRRRNIQTARVQPVPETRTR